MSADPIDLSPRIPHQILTSLLYKPRYRAKWMPYVQRRRGNTINQRAVAAFIAGQLSDDLEHEISPQKLKDRVSRALKGEAISDATAKLFITAFDFTPQEARELERALSTHNMNLRVAQRSTFTKPRDKSSANHHYTSLSTYMDCRIDKCGYLYEATFTEVIQAEDQQVETIAPRFESAAVDCTVLEGGELVEVQKIYDVEPHHEYNSLHQFVIKPTHPIRKGEIHQVRYRMNLDVPGMLCHDDSDNSVVLGPFEPARFNFSLRLNFDELGTNLTQKLWNKVMDDANLLETHEIPPQKAYSIYFPLIEDTVYSFSWECHVEEARKHFATKK